MAALALAAIGAQVPVILAMAGDAQRRGLDRARRLLMTVGTLEIGVPTEEREAGLLGVIEIPLRPTVRRVTALAFFPEAALVHVLAAVAVDTARGRRRVGQGGMTLHAADHPMQPQQRIGAQIMVKTDAGAP